MTTRALCYYTQGFVNLPGLGAACQPPGDGTFQQFVPSQPVNGYMLNNWSSGGGVAPFPLSGMFSFTFTAAQWTAFINSTIGAQLTTPETTGVPAMIVALN